MPTISAPTSPPPVRRRRVLAASPDHVWEVLADGWLYPLWVVGATRMRDVDAGWPELGARLHHSVGCWPLVLDDVTEVRDCEPQRLLHLEAHGWPLGRAEVVLRLTSWPPMGTEVTIEERATQGPMAWIPLALQRPILAWRNTETLRRLAYLAERRP